MNKQVKIEEIETSVGGGFSVSMVGAVPFIMPLGASLRDDQLQGLRNACRMQVIQRMKAAVAIVGHIERELGVGPELHIAGVLAAASWIEAANRTAEEGRAKAASARAGELMKPLRPHDLTPTAEYNLAEAALQRLAAIEATKTKNRRAATTALAEAKHHERLAILAQRTMVDAVWIEGAEAETVALRMARGDDLVDPGLEEGARFSVRDGLEVLFDAGTIKPLLWMAGRSYRTLLENAPQRLRSQLDDSPSKASSDPEWGRVRGGLNRAKAGVRLTRVEFEVVRHVGMRGRRVLRWVAGMGGSINALGTSGAARRVNTDLLIKALDVAALVIWKTAGLRIGGN